MLHCQEKHEGLFALLLSGEREGRKKKKKRIISCQQMATAHYCVNVQHGKWNDKLISIHWELLTESDMCSCHFISCHINQVLDN